MNYDLEIFDSVTGRKPLDVVKKFHEAGPEPPKPGPLDEGKEISKRFLASELMKANPKFRTTDTDFEEFKKYYSFSDEEGKIHYRGIELTTGTGDESIHVILNDDSSVVSVPYGLPKVDAETLFKEAWRYIGIISKDKDSFIYDPQLQELINLDTDFPKVLDIYKQGPTCDLETASVKFWWKNCGD
jgi:hypothetical protein